MKCRECANGKPIAEGGVYCVQYGIIINREHECTRRGARRRGRIEDHHSDDGEGETEIQKNGGGTVIALPGILYKTGE
ncbi:MAG: hypothetical protein J6U01_05995 [Clostridia bacterium]|nr:hypothetical protein [Clostridia bacterium]